MKKNIYIYIFMHVTVHSSSMQFHSLRRIACHLINTFFEFCKTMQQQHIEKKTARGVIRLYTMYSVDFHENST